MSLYVDPIIIFNPPPPRGRRGSEEAIDAHNLHFFHRISLVFFRSKTLVNDAKWNP